MFKNPGDGQPKNRQRQSASPQEASHSIQETPQKAQNCRPVHRGRTRFPEGMPYDQIDGDPERPLEAHQGSFGVTRSENSSNSA